VMAAANPNVRVTCLENSPVFSEHLRQKAARYGLTNIDIVQAQIKRGWYDVGELDGQWALAVIDGPPSKNANRLEVLNRADLARAVIVADDVQPDGGIAGVHEALSPTHQVMTFETESVRHFAIGVPRQARQAEAA